MRFRVFKDTLTIGVTRPVTEFNMTAVPVFRRADVPIKVTSDYDDTIRRHLCCLLIKQAPKLILGLIGAAGLRSIRREEVIGSLLAATTIFISRSSKRSTPTIESRNRSEMMTPTPLVVLGLPHKTALMPRPMSLDLRQDHFVSCTAQKSTLLRSCASTNSHERPVNVPTFNVATRVLPTLRTFGLAQLVPDAVLTSGTLAYFSHSPGSASARRLPRTP
ncbi:unnamed protein product [Heligmosomoides polygyrus]|uniref:Uncharacterized protein n=1 Tax=Heligmosomoides polygyrus TaxID=6339 RepID=A0A183GAF0_HELPZ|nr:unnamed protein product [Heligmosomoides polygyrus]